jgi:hypothetical protein
LPRSIGNRRAKRASKLIPAAETCFDELAQFLVRHLEAELKDIFNDL